MIILQSKSKLEKLKIDTLLLTQTKITAQVKNKERAD
jgi:hypothetical protein